MQTLHETSPSFWSPELWGRPATGNWSLARAVVVGPYPTRQFFQQLFATGLEQASLLLVVDEAWPVEEVEAICKGVEAGGGSAQVRWAWSKGLVHAKLYFFEWRESKSDKRRTVLGWGSPNASVAAFSGANAEAVSIIDLAKLGKSSDAIDAINRWVEHLYRPKGKAQALDCMLEHVRLIVPGFNFKTEPAASTFFGWLQAGRLCHKYDPDQYFGRFVLPLKKPIGSVLGPIFERTHFGEESKSKQVRYTYAAIQGEGGKQERQPQWKGKYFTETWFGHWASARAYRDLAATFVAKNASGREALVNQISGATPKRRMGWLDQLNTDLQALKKGMKKSGIDPSEYFHLDSKGGFSLKKYREVAERQLKQQIKRAKRQTFRDRYIGGYEFPPLPTLREAGLDGYDFGDFAEAFCETLLEAMMKPKPRNHLAIILLNKFGREQVAENGAAWLCRELSKNWSSYAALLDGYHRGSPKLRLEKQSRRVGKGRR